MHVVPKFLSIFVSQMVIFVFLENILPLRLIELLDSEENWRKKSLSGDSSGSGKQLYAEVHQNTVLYHNLYQYLTYK